MSDNPNPNTKPYRNHEIHFEPNWEFRVTGPEFDESKYAIRFASYKAAREEIDKRVDDTERLRARNIKLYVCVLNDHGDPLTITSINRVSGEIREATSDIYPNVSWIAVALKRKSELTNELRDINSGIERTKINFKRSLFGRIEAERYAHHIDELKKEIDEKTTLANEMQKPQPTEGTGDQKTA